MEYRANSPYFLHVTRGAKTLKKKLLGGASATDEVIAFGVELQEGDLLEVVTVGHKLGFDGLDRDDCEGSEQDGLIRVGTSGTYDVHLSTAHRGHERLIINTPDEASASMAASQRANLSKMRRHKAKEGTLTVLHNLFIAALVFIWLIPIFWLVFVSFSGDLSGPSVYDFFPRRWSVENYGRLFGQVNDINRFPTWFGNTLIVSACSTVVSTLFVLSTAFAFSRFRFKKRKGLMNLSMIIALFPGMLTMFVSYCLFEYVFKLNSAHVRLILAYSATSGLGYLVAKGFFDTIPVSIDEAARIDGASKARIFFQILIPLSKPIIVYTIITAFMAPWVDFVMAGIILGNASNASDYTVALGLMYFISDSNIADWFGAFAAGSVLISIPLSLLFLFVQKYYVGGVTGGAVKG